MKFKNFLSLFLLFIVTYSWSQTIEIKGTITESKDKKPLVGVNVVVKNSKKGVTSDFDGNYSIKVNSSDVLIFSNIGYASKEIKVEKAQILNVTLVEEANKLEEIVINVGYGTQKKKNIASAISSIKSDAFDDRPLYSVGQAIQGNAAGVNVVQPSGKPGVGLDIRIRGLSSIQSGNNPLFVIDGVQTYNSDGINTDDIADIQILKDAASTAIYGVNGSAGVILITTKRGKANKNSFSFSSYLGTSKIVSKVDVLNLDQYKALQSEINASNVTTANNPKYAGINTDWTDKVFQTGQDQNYDLSYSGGTDKVKAFASLGYLDSKGIVKPSKFTRLSSRINLDIDASSRFKAHVNMNVIRTNLNNTSDNARTNRGGVILSTLTTPSFLPVYGEELIGRVIDPITGEYANGEKDGQFASNPYQASWENPVAYQNRQNITKVNRYMGNVSFDVTIAKNLVWKPSSAIEISRSVNEQFVDSYRTAYGRNDSDPNPANKGYGTQETRSDQTWNLENTLNYTLKSGDHDLSLLAGSSIQKNRYDINKIQGSGFTTDLRALDITKMMYIDRFASDTIAREVNSLSYFGRATYIFKGKYIFNGIYRASGASKLASGHKWGYFPGVSAAWILSNEDFLKNSTSVSELKLRGGWGQTGNLSGIREYSAFALLRDDNGTPYNYLNTDLTWETNTDISVGLDLGILNNRVKLTVDAFQKTTKDLINYIRFSTISNDTEYIYNAGKLQNKGIEMGLNTVNLKGDFNWNTNFNISFIKNKILEMGLQPIEYYGNIEGYGEAIQLVKNASLGTFFGYVVDQVNPTSGLLEYKDLNGDGKVDPSDRTTIGNAMPDYTFGLTNTFSYKGFSLDMLFTGSQGNDVFNASRIELEGMQDSKNQSTAVLNRWTTAGQITNIPRALDPTANFLSSRWVEDGSYVRLKSATLAYSFKKLFLGLTSLKIYATGQNLVTWTNYSGFDPEISAFNSNTGTSPGIDFGTYPQVKTFIFGLKAGF